MSSDSPFLSIGVTAYNRIHLLKEALDSILHQDFSDFEILIGNDYVAEPLSAEILNISDPRIKIYNHPVNLGETANLNFLLNTARGKYMTWLADDDLFAPGYFSRIYEVIAQYGFPPIVFSSYQIIYGLNVPDQKPAVSGNVRILTGKSFLRGYFESKIKVMGVNGVYATSKLKEMTGFPAYADSKIGLYGEYGLLLRSSLVEHIIYLEEPLVLYRFHSEVGGSNQDIVHYDSASRKFIQESIQILSSPQVASDFYVNFRSVLHLCAMYYSFRVKAKYRFLTYGNMLPYILSLKRELNEIPDCDIRFKARTAFVSELIRFIFIILKEQLRNRTPSIFWNVLRNLRKSLLGEPKRSFWN
jgi:glycosyltransferase involved in cell wall biosynthesis